MKSYDSFDTNCSNQSTKFVANNSEITDESHKTNINNEKIHCGNIVREICQKCNGNGGGNQFFAQGGGSNAKDLSTYLK